jgi:hypothetical protein
MTKNKGLSCFKLGYNPIQQDIYKYDLFRQIWGF